MKGRRGVNRPGGLPTEPKPGFWLERGEKGAFLQLRCGVAPGEKKKWKRKRVRYQLRILLSWGVEFWGNTGVELTVKYLSFKEVIRAH